MEGLLPHVGWRKVRGRRVAGRGPAYICRFAGWPSQLEPVVVGLGVVRATASWRGGVALPNLGGGYPPGKVPGPKANPRAPPGWSGHFQCARRPGGTSQEVSVKESQRRTSHSVISKSPKQDKPQVRGEFMAILLCNMNINQICD